MKKISLGIFIILSIISILSSVSVFLLLGEYGTVIPLGIDVISLLIISIWLFFHLSKDEELNLYDKIMCGFTGIAGALFIIMFLMGSILNA